MHIRPTIPSSATLTRRREADIEAASAAMLLAHAAAEAFAALLDRHPGDAGDNPEAIHELIEVIEALAASMSASRRRVSVALLGIVGLMCICGLPFGDQQVTTSVTRHASPFVAESATKGALR